MSLKNFSTLPSSESPEAGAPCVPPSGGGHSMQGVGVGRTVPGISPAGAEVANERQSTSTPRDKSNFRIGSDSPCGLQAHEHRARVPRIIHEIKDADCAVFDILLHANRFAEARALAQRKASGGSPLWAVYLALAELQAGFTEQARSLFILAEGLVSNCPDESVKGLFSVNYAITLRRLGEAQLARQYYYDAIVSFGLADDLRREALALNNLAYLLTTFGEYAEAYAKLDDAERLYVALDERHRQAEVWDTRARVLIAERRFAEAASLSAQAVSVLLDSGQERALKDARETYDSIPAAMKAAR